MKRKLASLPPRLAAAPMRLAAPKDEGALTRYRRQVNPWRKWYNTARWQKLRWQVLTEAMFTCAMCRRVVVDKEQAVADHKIPHKGDPDLFWSRANLTCLCKPCHDGAKAKLERQQGFR